MAIIVVNRSESYCLSCPRGKNGAMMHEKGHYTQAGWRANGEPGCGEPWTGITSDYLGPGFDDIEHHYFNEPALMGLPVIRRVWSG